MGQDDETLDWNLNKCLRHLTGSTTSVDAYKNCSREKYESQESQKEKH